MTKQLFDPFQDRKSRDIRNSLSTALFESIDSDENSKIYDIAKSFEVSTLEDYYSEYVTNRLRRYEEALQVISKGREDPIWRALVLWDLELFFEVHEVLEHAWYSAKGEEKLLLQALIRAAGVFIKQELGYDVQARKIAAKAIAVLEHTTLLSEYCDVTILTDALTKPGTMAPKLL